MARIMSIVMSIFILVPAVAPSIGQGIIIFGGWRATFMLLLVMALVAVIWFAVRQPETLQVAQRRVFSLSNIASGIAEACSYRRTFGYTIAAGLMFGAFLGYLSSAQQVFQVTYHSGAYFALYFGLAALAIGAAAVVNAAVVMRLGMRVPTWRAIAAITLLSFAFVLPAAAMDGSPPFWAFMTWLLIIFFCMGIVFGNLNALAMEPLGNMAGLGAALVGSLSTFISLPLGWAVGYLFDGGIVPLVAGFAVLGLTALAVMWWTERGSVEADLQVQTG